MLNKNPYVRCQKYSDERTSKSGAESNLDAARGIIRAKLPDCEFVSKLVTTRSQGSGSSVITTGEPSVPGMICEEDEAQGRNTFSLIRNNKNISCSAHLN